MTLGATRRFVAIEGHRVDPDLHRVLSEQIPHTGLLEHVESAIGQAQAQFRTYLENRRGELGPKDLELATFICATCIEALAHNAVLHRANTLGHGRTDRRGSLRLIGEQSQPRKFAPLQGCRSRVSRFAAAARLAE